MLEPLIVLTVLNCFFMFSSTVTTCALWWQYRSHRCCFKKDPVQQTARQALSKLKSSYAAKSSKKSGNPKQDPIKEPNDSKSNSTVNRENKKGRISKQRTKSNLKNTLQNKTPSEVSSRETMGNWEVEERMRMSEASQTANDAKSAVVMEYSTVQKIVQILDDDTDLTATKFVIRDLNNKQNVEEKKPDHESKFEPPLMPVYTRVSQN